MVAKEKDFGVGNLLLFVFVFLNDDKNTSLEEEEEEEKVLALLPLLFIVVVAIRPRSACLIIFTNVFRYNGKYKEKSDFLETPACTQKRSLFTFLLKKKKSHLFACLKKKL